MNFRRTAFWILCLSALSVGLRNFENGIGIDAKTYGLLARGVARSGEWFQLTGTTAELTTFTGHPHLGIWLVALVFKILPAADWSGRIVGHLCYVGFLLLFFYFLRRKNDERTAVVGVLLLWIWAIFSNFFSNIYLDPPFLFFAFLSLVLWDHAMEKGRAGLAALAGVAIALSAMSKGMTVLAFGPALAWVFLSQIRSQPLKFLAANLGAYLGGLALVLGVYYVAVRYSAVPDFFTLYFNYQWKQRFATQWDWGQLVYGPFWRGLLKDTYYLGILGWLTLARLRRQRSLVLPWILLLTFAAMYAPAGRFGANYWITVLPWMAWLTAAQISRWRSWPTRPVVCFTASFAIFAVVVIQYLPIRTHGARELPEIGAIQWLKETGRASSLLFDQTPEPIDFTRTDNYAWYTDLPLRYLEKQETAAAPEQGQALLVYNAHPDRDARLRQAKWCLYDTYFGRQVWIGCP